MTKKTVAELLLAIQAVSLSPKKPYVWSSGILSPIYCDNRLILSYLKERKKIEEALGELIQKNYPQATLIAGTATAGIPHAAFVSQNLDLPMIYVRSSSKDHGKNKAIEGKLSSKDKVVVVEDLISTGGSALRAAKKIREEGVEVLGIVSIFTYQLEEGYQAFKEAKLTYQSLTDYTTLIEVAKSDPMIEENKASLLEWYQNPTTWGKEG